MIVFDLKCENNHQFESWFRSSADYAEQQDRGLVTCPMCNSAKVGKAVMAPNVAAKGNQKADVPVQHAAEPARDMTAPFPSSTVGGSAVAKPAQAPDAPASNELQELQEKVAEVAKAMRTYVEKNCDDVGDKFAEEARKIHYGETEARGIYGNATADEATELLDEGIELIPIPGAKRLDA